MIFYKKDSRLSPAELSALVTLVGEVAIQMNNRYCKVFPVYERLGSYMFFHEGSEFHKIEIAGIEEGRNNYDGDVWATYDNSKEYRQIDGLRVGNPSVLHIGYNFMKGI